MTIKPTAFVLLFALVLFSCKNKSESTTLEDDNQENIIVTLPQKDTDVSEAGVKKGFNIYPIEHASLVLNWDGDIIYIDPVGRKEDFLRYKEPDMILITDIHPDHLDTKLLESVVTEKTSIIAPKAVFKKLPKAIQNNTEVIDNGGKTSDYEIAIEAIPMYNLRKEALKYHKKGRGNGYVLERNGKRVYISGDTEDIPEMRNLKNIDIAFVCMNLPYTMTVEKAAEAVLAFKPKTVYPYHYRGENGMSDVAKFKALVEAGNPDIKVVQLDWYAR